jgi:hypothetical protein
LTKELERMNMVKNVNGNYYQTSDNCYQIATYIAKKFGFNVPPKSTISELIKKFKTMLIWDKEEYHRINEKAEAWLIVREPDRLRGVINDVHITFRCSGTEFNFGPNEEHGFEISVIIPLQKA